MPVLEESSRNRDYHLSPWRDWDRFLAEMVKIVRDLDRNPTPEEIAGFPTADDIKTDLPSESQLRRAGRHDLVTAICDFYGGYTALRKQLGFPYIRKGEDSLSLWPNLRRELCAVVRGLETVPSEAEAADFPTEEERQKPFPHAKTLLELGRGDIISAITQQHGGYQAVQRKLGYTPPRKRGPQSLNRWENMLAELYMIMRDTDERPSPEELAGFPNSAEVEKGLPAAEEFLKGSSDQV